ncbi:MAG: hypothetical protein IKV99_08530 [Oscillospiraceae bacterium]|nr:hypothetical protein [Oscillospiraceae bacterium]
MIDRAWRKWEVAGLFFVLLWGNLFHFVFDWSGENELVGAIAAVNESVWEHLKLLIVPWVLWSAVEALAMRRIRIRVLAPRAAALLAGVLCIPAAYYTYVGSSGANVAILNIIIFQLAVLLAFFISWRLLDNGRLQGAIWSVLGGAVLLTLLGLAVYWTYSPPEIPLFTDSQTGQTGIVNEL